MCHELGAYSIVCYEMCHDHDTFLDTEKVCQECQITFVTDWLRTSGNVVFWNGLQDEYVIFGMRYDDTTCVESSDTT